MAIVDRVREGAEVRAKQGRSARGVDARKHGAAEPDRDEGNQETSSLTRGIDRLAEAVSPGGSHFAGAFTLDPSRLEGAWDALAADTASHTIGRMPKNLQRALRDTIRERMAGGRRKG